jgi:hypothetical protein
MFTQMYAAPGRRTRQPENVFRGVKARAQFADQASVISGRADLGADFIW